MRSAAFMSVLACSCAAVVVAKSACASPAKTTEELLAENEERRQSVIAQLERRQCPYRAVSIYKGSPYKMVRRGPNPQNSHQFHRRSIHILRNLSVAVGSK